MNIVEVLFEYVDYIFGGDFRDLSFVYNRRSFAARNAVADDFVDVAGRRLNRSHNNPGPVRQTSSPCRPQETLR